MSTITLKYPATCSDCGAKLHPGEKAKYYSRRKVYGIGCHAKPANLKSRRRRPRYPMVDYDREIMAECERVGATMHYARCGCEDYPCCGH